MVKVQLESLPLGFRFHPTDEELINHYLKGKINGRKGQVDVIREIDVCKCEPWDLPGMSLIKTVDPEWFFFTPRDRKYPHGHRSNRATDAGYWKATGKDRTIKSRISAGNTVIGMKKTLVFYRGRAPKGERTGWIMHEYRTVENEQGGAAGDQGAYVLCRLFKKQLERNLNPDCVELDEDGFSPTPTKSSPWNTEHGEEFDTVVDKKDLMQQMQKEEPLADVVEEHSLLDGCGMPPAPPEDSNSYSNSTPSVVDLDICSERPEEPNVSLVDDYGPSQFKVINHDKTSGNGIAEDDHVTKFLDSVLCDPDEYSREESSYQRNSTAVAMSEHANQTYGAEVASLPDLTGDEHIRAIDEFAPLESLQAKNEGADIDKWSFSDSLNSPEGIAFVHDNNELDGVDDLSTLWSWTVDNPDLMANMISVDSPDGIGSTGIDIRPRHSQIQASSASDQGTANRRIRLVRKLSAECSLPSDSSSNRAVRATKTPTSHVHKDAEEKLPQADHVEPVDIHNRGQPHDEKEDPTSTNLVNESKSLLRRRLQSNDVASELPRLPVAQKPQQGRVGFASVHVVVGAVLLIVLIMLISGYLS